MFINDEIREVPGAETTSNLDPLTTPQAEALRVVATSIPPFQFDGWTVGSEMGRMTTVSNWAYK